MFVPYLHFRGECEAAMTFYAEVFGTTVPEFFRYCDIPGAEGEIASSRLICNAALSLPGGVALMACDFPPGESGDLQKAVSLHVSAPTSAEARARFDRLLEGGDVTMPFARTFWAEGFGMLRDRFGTHWMLSGPALT